MAKTKILNGPVDELIKKYKEALIKNGVRLQKLILFGSRAKGTEKPWSDIDLCVVSPDFGVDRHDETVRLMNIASPIEPLIEPHPYNPAGLAEYWDTLAHEIRTHGKTLDI